MRDIFITENFLLQSDAAIELYHNDAKDEPIIDYHCHLPPAQIAEDARFENLTQVWLYGDHYKWRLMRANGVDERLCTGDASDWEKFMAWAETVPATLCNPMYHWTHLELKRFFGISDRLLGPETAKGIWEACREQLAGDDLSARGMMTRMKVKLVCTTDDPTDTLAHHKAIAADKTFAVKVLPTWRPDKGMAVGDPKRFNAWVDALAEAVGMEIRRFDDYLAALRKRHDAFHALGCRVSDHGLETICAVDYTEAEIKRFFRGIRDGGPLDPAEAAKFSAAMLYEFGLMDGEKGWTQQLHLGALRNNNTRMLERLGPDTGYDSIGDFEIARPLVRFLDRLEQAGKLPKTVLYNLNPRDNALLATMIGNFQDGRVPGKMQFGSSWWFLDHKSGMEAQMRVLSNVGLLSRFIGMTTDSRSFLSYPRHEYFRRILCNLLGDEIEKGLLPRDMALVGNMVRDISYRNAARYFGFDL